MKKKVKLMMHVSLWWGSLAVNFLNLVANRDKKKLDLVSTGVTYACNGYHQIPLLLEREHY